MNLFLDDNSSSSSIVPSNAGTQESGSNILEDDFENLAIRSKEKKKLRGKGLGFL